MKSPKIWVSLATLFGATAFVSGCVTESSSPIIAPTLYTYTAEEQAQVLRELDAIPAPCMTCKFMEDYAAVRAEIRAIKNAR